MVLDVKEIEEEEEGEDVGPAGGNPGVMDFNSLLEPEWRALGRPVFVITDGV